jgi:acyl carrier protein
MLMARTGPGRHLVLSPAPGRKRRHCGRRRIDLDHARWDEAMRKSAVGVGTGQRVGEADGRRGEGSREMNEDDLRAAVLKSLRQVAPEAGESDLDERQTIREQIEFDSIDYLNYVLGLEKALDVKIVDADYPKFASIEGAVACLRRLLTSRGA